MFMFGEEKSQFYETDLLYACRLNDKKNDSLKLKMDATLT